MIKAEKAVELVDRLRGRLTKLDGENLAGVALVIPPEGQEMEFILLGEQADLRSFFTLLSDKLKVELDKTTEHRQFGGTTRMIR